MQPAIVSRSNPPPPIVADQSCSEQNRVAIFGSARDFVLKGQMIQTLDLWHRRAAQVIEDRENSGHNNTKEGWAEFTRIVETQHYIFKAALSAELISAGDVAILLAMVVRHARIQGDSVGEFIDT